MFNPDYPVYVGFNGEAGSGKTFTAKKIVPPSSAGAYGDVQNVSSDKVWDGLVKPINFTDIVWDHFWLSMPLYMMHEIKTQTTGEDAKNRILHLLSEVISEMMTNAVPYDDMVELVYDVYSFPAGDSNEKPREFLTGVGDLCRNLDEDCFTNYTRYKIEAKWRELKAEYERAEQDPPMYIPIISDVRMDNEAKMILAQPNHLLFKFQVSERVRELRLLDRDGKALTPTQKQHHTETTSQGMPLDWFDMIIDTDEITVDEQAQMVYNKIATSVHTFEEETV